MKPFLDPFPFRTPENRSDLAAVIAEITTEKTPAPIPPSKAGTRYDKYGDKLGKKPVPTKANPTTPRVSEPLKTESVLHEGGVKAALHDFMEGLPPKAVGALRPVMGDSSIRGGTLRAKVAAILKRNGVPSMVLGGSSAQIVIDNWDTFHGDLDESRMVGGAAGEAAHKRLHKTIGAVLKSK